jgi:hypothetical protein
LGIEAYASLSSNSNAKASATTIALSRNYKDRVSVFKIKAYVMFSEEPLYIFGLHGLWPMLRPSDRGCSAFISRRHPAASLQAHRATYEMEGPQDLLVPAVGTAGEGRVAAPAAPSSASPRCWAAYVQPRGISGQSD